MDTQRLPTYPRELIYWGRQNTTLAIEAHLSRPDVMPKRNEDAAEPLVKRSLSRFVIKLIGNQGGKKFNPMANISQVELKSLKKKSDFAFGKVMEARVRMNSSRLCETESLKMKPFAGKTPAEVLRENTQNANTLSGMLNTLSQSINDPAKQKFREGNIKQYNAIQEGLQLLSQGKLAKQGVKYPPVVVHNATFRHSSSYRDGSNNVLCYELRIVCEPSNTEYPFTVYISNCYAPVGYNGKPDRKRAVNKQERFMPLTLDEYIGMIEEMYDTARDFERATFKSQYGKACRYDQIRREMYRRTKEQQQFSRPGGNSGNVTPMPQRPQAQQTGYGNTAGPVQQGQQPAAQA